MLKVTVALDYDNLSEVAEALSHFLANYTEGKHLVIEVPSSTTYAYNDDQEFEIEALTFLNLTAMKPDEETTFEDLADLEADEQVDAILSLLDEEDEEEEGK